MGQQLLSKQTTTSREEGKDEACKEHDLPLAFEAMMKMTKIDIAAIEAARRG